MKKLMQVLQVAFTYIGTLVGAGFGSGQEVLKFFTKYGWIAPISIAFATFLLIWLGMKIMLLAHDLQVKTYDELNRVLFGHIVGRFLGIFTMVILFSFTATMIAGSGAVFKQQLQIPTQVGLLITVVCAYFVLVRGIHAIMNVNVVIIPTILVFCVFMLYHTFQSPSWTQALTLGPVFPDRHILDYLYHYGGSFCYTGFNLAIAQTILVPLGATIKDRNVLKWGAVLGGTILGLLLLSAHFILSSQMPDIASLEVPMANIMKNFSTLIVIMYTIVLFGQIFTTLIADAYGVISQVKNKTNINIKWVVLIMLVPCYIISHFGFQDLLSVIYPVFSGISLIWLAMIIFKKKPIANHHYSNQSPFESQADHHLNT